MNWSDWLQRAECHAVLELAARLILREAKRRSIPSRLLPESNGSAAQHPSSRGAPSIQAMVNTLWLYVQQQAKVWEQGHAFAALYAQGENRLVQFLARRYILHLLDLSRTQSASPYRALYRRLRQYLHSSDAVQYRLMGGHSYYACAHKDEQEALKDSASWGSSDSYKVWPAPPLSFCRDFHSLRRDEAVNVACFFWREVVRRLGKPCWVSVRELTRYLLTHVSVPPSEREVLFSELSADEEEDPIRDWHHAVDADQERTLVHRDLPRLAQKLLADWEEHERAVFYARHAIEQKLADIAELSGHRGPSGAKYLLEQLNRRVHDFCLTWPGLSFFDEDQELVHEFLEEVLKICKSAWEGRSD
ncbi:hypothetical protein [Desulfosoma sp.]